MNQINKQIAALSAAFLITACLGLGMLIMGANAVLAPNSRSAASAIQAVPAAANSQADQVARLQSLVAQYQQREQQYQKQLNTAQQELAQASSQLQQYQQIFQVLQQRGVLRFNSRESGSDSDHDF